MLLTTLNWASDMNNLKKIDNYSCLGELCPLYDEKKLLNTPHFIDLSMTMSH